MFFMLHLLIFIILEVSNSNSFLIKRQINPDRRDLTGNENFFKQEDGARDGGSTHINHNSLFKAVQNVSSSSSTTQNLKADLLDKMLSDEMFSMKEFIYKHKKVSTPSVEIKQKWPVLELMAKLNDINNADEYKDDADIDVLENFKVVDSPRKELFHVQIDQNNVTFNNTSIVPAINTLNISTYKTTTDFTTLPTQCTSRKIAEIDNKLQNYYSERTFEHKQARKQENFKQVDEPVKKVIELRSLKHRKRNKSNVKNEGTDNKNSCTCKTTRGNLRADNNSNSSFKTRCTASLNYLNTNEIQQTGSTQCTSNCKEPRQCATTVGNEPISANTNSASCPPNAQMTCYSIPSPNCNPATCYPTSTTSIYPSYPTPAPLYGSSINYQNGYQPYFYQPYQMFVPPLDISSVKEKKHKRKKCCNKHKDYADDELYDEDSLPKHDDYLDNAIKEEPKLDNDFREVILQGQDNINGKLCTQGIDNRERNDFVSEVLNDLKKFYGNSVLKNCYCGLRSSASAVASNITLPIFVYLCLSYFLNIFLFY